MQLLATPQQVIDLAFAANEKITPVSIKETKIDAAQEKYIRPVLGKLYDALLDGKYPELLDNYVRPALAYYVRYSVIPDLALKLNDKGAQTYFSEYANTATDKQRSEMRQQRKTMRMLCSIRLSATFRKTERDIRNTNPGKTSATK